MAIHSPLLPLQRNRIAGSIHCFTFDAPQTLQPVSSNFCMPETIALNTLVHSFWQVNHKTSHRNEYIIPKGVIELVFNFSDSESISASLGGKQYELTRCFINGFNRLPIGVSLPERQTFFGVQLQPMAVKHLLRAPGKEFSDRPVDLCLLGKDFEILWHQLGIAPTFETRVAIFSAWIERKQVNWSPQEKYVNEFLCSAGQYDLTVPQLAETVCYSVRQLSRKLLEATGMNTEEILLYKKYLQSVHLMHYSDLSLTQIGYRSNFSDQSHFIRSFKLFAGMTPGEYHHSKAAVKGHLYRDVR
jgi:AraC-like DNA-binding protein